MLPYVIPQVEFSSLLPGSPRDERRVDFALFHPALSEKIIIEIDGKQHSSQSLDDRQRDQILHRYGYRIFRIPAGEIRMGKGAYLNNLKEFIDQWSNKKDFDRLPSDPVEKAPEEFSDLEKFVLSIKISHQIQVPLCKALREGFLSIHNKKWSIVSDIEELGIFDYNMGCVIIRECLTDFLTLLLQTMALYKFEEPISQADFALLSYCKNKSIPSGPDREILYLNFSNTHSLEHPTFYIQNIYFPHSITFGSLSSPLPVSPLSQGLPKIPPERDLQYFLQYIFRKESFREGQYAGILRSLQQKDSIVLLPTGAGKSIIFQLSSFLMPGGVIVVAPIIALMNDQVDNLR